jgi:hypothetical protein
MNCPSCGEEVQPGADLCLGCGEPLSPGRVTPTAPLPSPHAQLARPPSADAAQAAVGQGAERDPIFESRERVFAARPVAAPRRRSSADDEKDPRCPGCGVRNPREAARCRGCGARFPPH